MYLVNPHSLFRLSGIEREDSQAGGLLRVKTEEGGAARVGDKVLREEGREGGREGGRSMSKARTKFLRPRPPSLPFSFPSLPPVPHIKRPPKRRRVCA